MKRHYPIGLFLLLALMAACTKVPEPERSLSLSKGRRVEGPTPALQAIDSLMWQQPDSALLALMAYEGDASEYNNHYAQLLTSELLYKNDYEQTNRRELRQAVVYFDSLMQVSEPQRSLSLSKGRSASAKTTAFLDARAHYINGVGYYERDSVIDACREYLKALEVMEGHFEGKELVGKKARFMALTYTRLTDVFTDYYLHEQAIYFAQCSLPYYEKQKSTSWHLSWALNQIGSHYDMMGVLDSADYYFKKSTEVLNDTNALMYRDIAAHLTYLDYKKDSQEANKAIEKLFELLTNAKNENESHARYLYIAEIFYHEKEFDSAWVYLDKLFQETSVVGIKRQAAEWLADICKIQGRPSEMLEYASYLVPFANMEENNSELKSQLLEIYNIYTQRRLEWQHHNEKLKHARLTIIVFGGMFSAIVIVVFLYHKNKRKKQKLEVQIKSERLSHKMQQAAMAGRLKRSNAALKEKSKTRTLIAPSLNDQKQEKANSYADEPICRHILAICNDKNNPIKSTVPVSAYANIALDNIQKAQLKEAAYRHYGELFEKLKQLHSELKDKDYLYCYLCLLGLDNIQIATILQKSVSTIWDREKRLQRIFGSRDKIAVILSQIIIG